MSAEFWVLAFEREDGMYHRPDPKESDPDGGGNTRCGVRWYTRIYAKPQPDEQCPACVEEERVAPVEEAA